MRAFTRQMRIRIGMEIQGLDEPYLPFLVARAQLRYLQRLERLAPHPSAAKARNGDAPETFLLPAFDEGEMEEAIETETRCAEIETSQELDSARQQSAGITHYIWSGGDCEDCAPLDGELCAWGEGDEPGDIHPNCQCSAEPTAIDAGDANPPEITAEDIAALALIEASDGLESTVEIIAEP